MQGRLTFAVPYDGRHSLDRADVRTLQVDGVHRQGVWMVGRRQGNAGRDGELIPTVRNATEVPSIYELAAPSGGRQTADRRHGVKVEVLNGHMSLPAGVVVGM
ncbi:hypothetical protein BMS3Bbin02_01160 [bacterium BMS3Bbin02]|nr:hypothetical protein BMS3Bbin02_01160 [bacterium BMS3Bbin02]